MSALTDTFTNIANAIRAKTGKSGTMTPSQMVTEIAGIPSGGGNSALYEIKNNNYTYSISFSENAKYIIVPTITNCDNEQSTIKRANGTIIFDIENNRHTMIGTGHTSHAPATWTSGLSPVTYYYIIVSPPATTTITFSSVTKNSITFTDSAGPAYRDIIIIY